MNYNIDVVIETLNITLKQALIGHPQYVPWLRIEGDLEFRMFKNGFNLQFWQTIN